MFWCFHPAWTFPQTRDGRTYVVCLECGREFDFDWQAMKRGKQREPPKREELPPPAPVE